MALNKTRIYNYTDHFWVTGIWLVVFSLPLVILRDSTYIDWSKAFQVWRRLIPYLLLFVLNHYLLVPYLLFAKKRLAYFVAALFFISLLSFEQFLRPEPHWQTNIKAASRPDGMREFPPPAHGSFPPPKAQTKMEPGAPGHMLPGQQPPGQLPPFVNVVLVSFLILGFDTGLKASFRWAASEKEKVALENESVQNQLAFLKNQISPHFFMNTLNNIHALIDINGEEAKEAIIKLSKLMRYLLYESDGGWVPIEKEFEFITSYVNLMKLRFSEKVRIKLNISGNIPNKNIPPMLFTSLLENAFKHGISYKEESFITIDMLSTQATLVFEIKNRKVQEHLEDNNSGIGIENTRKRLHLIYGNTHQMKITDDNELFMVNVTLPL